MVALDDGALAAQAAFHHVGVDGALGQELHLADLLGLSLEDADELLADDLALALRLGDTGELLQETVLGVDTAHVHVELAGHDLLHLVAFILAQEAVVHEDAGQLIAHGPLQKRGGHGAVHAAAEGQQDPAIADLGAALGDGLVHVGGHCPLPLEAADAVQEVLQNLPAVLSMHHLRVELHAVEPLFAVLHSGVTAAGAGGDDAEAGSGALHLHAVAHPVDRRLRYTGKQGRVPGVVQLRLAVLPRVRPAAGAAQQVHHQLHAVADAQHGDAHFKESLIHHGSALVKHGGGAAGEDQGVGGKGTHLVQGDAVGFDLAVHAALADAAGDQQVVLAAKIQDQNTLHASSSRKVMPVSSAWSMTASAL